MQTMFDPWFPPGRQAYWKANFLHGLPDDAIEVFHRYALTAPSPYTTGPWLESVHGAVSRIDPAETAFAHRRHPYNFLVLSSWSEPSEADRYQMIRTYFQMLIEEELPDAVGKMKQFASWFTHGVPGGAALRKAIYESKSAVEILGRVEEFFEVRLSAQYLVPST